MSEAKPGPALWRLAWRLYRRHWRKLLFFSACIAAGVAFLFCIGNLLSAIRQGVASRARELLAADVEVSSSRPFDARTLRVLAGLDSEGVRQSDELSFMSMLKAPGSAPFLVTVKAVDPSYPFYGRIVSDPPDFRPALFGDKPACLIEDSIAIQHGVKPQAELALGRLSLRAAASVIKEPARAMTGLSVAPHVIVPLSLARKTGLLQFGSRVEYRRLLALPPSLDPARAARKLKTRLEKELDDPYLRLTDYTQAQPNLREALSRVTSFFVLIALVGLILGSVGMASSVTIFLNEQLETVGVLRCLGLGPRHIGRLYGGLCLAIGLQGGVLGAAGGWGLGLLSLSVVRRILNLQIETAGGFYLPIFAEALAIACALALAINLGKVRTLAGLAPLDLLRERVKGLPPSPRFTAAALVGGLIAVFLYAWAKADSFAVARDFSLALAGAGIAISILIRFALALLDRWLSFSDRLLPFSLRHGLLQLTRRRGRTVVFLSTLSAGFCLLGALSIVHRSLAKEILLGKASEVPGLFLIDVQKSQVKGVAALARRYSPTGAEFAPLVRARLQAINGTGLHRRELSGLSVEERSRWRFLTREYNLTYKDAPHASEQIVAGRFWGPGETSPQASLEEGFARRMGLKLGDRLAFDVQGREVAAPVTSLRAIQWMSMKPNFFVVLPPAVLEGAPQTFVASVDIRDGKAAAAFKTELLKGFPNVSAIDVTKILETVSAVLETLLKALQVLAWFCVGVGLLVLAGTLSLGQKERRETAALFMALGCGRAELARIDRQPITKSGPLLTA